MSSIRGCGGAQSFFASGLEKRTPLSARHAALLGTLEEMVSSEGFGDLGVGSIARRLRCSRSTPYAIAPSKEQLFVVLVDRVVCRIESAAVAASEREREPAARLAEFQRSFIDKLRRLIEEGIDAGAFLPVNATFALLIVGGNDTTRNAISGGVLALNEFPDEYEKLRNGPSLIPNMVDEMIRWQTPLAHMRRTATRDTELAGKQIKKGEKFAMWYVSGNRDETAIERANGFLIDRANANHHLSSGWGVHFCMGSRVAQLQLRVLWEEIMKHFRFVEVVGEPVRVKPNLSQAFMELPVRVHRS